MFATLKGFYLWLTGVEHLRVTVNNGFSIIVGTLVFFSGAPYLQLWKRWPFRKVIKGLPTITINGKASGVVELHSNGAPIVDIGSWDEFRNEIDEWLFQLIERKCFFKDKALLMAKVHGRQLRYESMVCRGVNVVLLDCKTPDDYWY